MHAGYWTGAISMMAMCSAQQLVAPLGTDYLSGIGNGRDLWNAQQMRFLVVLDRSQFPWGARDFRLTGLKVRRSTQGIVYGLDDHVKTSSVVLSVDGRAANNLSTTFAQNHGPQTNTVLSRGSVWFPCGPRIENVGTYVATRFDDPSTATFAFASPFLVPATATNLVIEFQIHDTDDENLDWPVDDEPNGPDRGGMRRMGQACPYQAPHCDKNSRVLRPLEDVGSNGLAVGFETSLFTVLDGLSKSGLLLLGEARSTPIVLPNGCQLWVNPFLWLPVTAAEDRLTYVFRLPNRPEWVGLVLGGQFAVVDAVANTVSMGPGVALTVGSCVRRNTQFAGLHRAVAATEPWPETGDRVGAVPVIEFLGRVQ